MTTVECPICQEPKTSFVKLECNHSICLKCYHNCIYHNIVTCSLCRAEIKELGETCELIRDLEKDVEDLEKTCDDLKDLQEELEEVLAETTNRKEELEERVAEMEYRLM